MIRPVMTAWLLVSAMTLWASTQGAMPISTEQGITALQAWLRSDGQTPEGADYVLMYIRVPRVVLAVLVGAALGLSGALTQALFRNPLADPGILGVTSGAACTTALALILISGAASAPWLPLAAFVGAMMVCLLLDQLARWLAPGSIAGLVMAGMAVNAVGSALIGLSTYLADDDQLRSLSFWLLGSVAQANWQVVSVLAAVLLLTYPLAMARRTLLNALALGDDVAAEVGVNVPRLRWQTIALIALTCGAAVAWCGIVSFVGLLAPHLARAWAQSDDQRKVLPLSVVIGSALLLSADTLARSLVQPAEIPVGILTALLGGGVLLWKIQSLARRQRGL